MNLFIIILIIILVVIILCYVIKYNINNIDNFNPPTVSAETTVSTVTTASPQTTPTTIILSPLNVRIIRINENEFKVNFHYPKNSNITKFIIVISQYTSQLESVGELKILVSDESIGSLSAICHSQGSLNQNNKCSHTFSNIARIDNENNNYLYRIGVAALGENAMGENAISVFAEPNNIPLLGGKRMFTMEKDFKFISLDAINLSTTSSIPVSGMSNSDFLNEGIDSQYDLLTNQLGGYPYNAILSSTSTTQNLLSDLVNKSMADKIVNINLI